MFIDLGLCIDNALIEYYEYENFCPGQDRDIPIISNVRSK